MISVYLDTLLQISDVDSLCLKQLRHDVPENTHTRYQSMYTVNTVINTSTYINTNSTHSFLRAERLFSSLTWWLGSDRLTSGSESDRLLGISSSSRSLLSWQGHRTHKDYIQKTAPTKYYYFTSQFELIFCVFLPASSLPAPSPAGGGTAPSGRWSRGNVCPPWRRSGGARCGGRGLSPACFQPIGSAGEPSPGCAERHRDRYVMVFVHIYILYLCTVRLCMFSPWRTHRTLCVGSAVLASQPPLPPATCAWPGSGHLTAAANPEPAMKRTFFILLLYCRFNISGYQFFSHQWSTCWAWFWNIRYCWHWSSLRFFKVQKWRTLFSLWSSSLRIPAQTHLNQ